MDIKQITAAEIIRYVIGLLLPVFMPPPYWSRGRGPMIIRGKIASGINPVSTSE